MSTFEWFDMYRIGIEIIGDEYIFVSSAALNWKSPGKIGVEFACWFIVADGCRIPRVCVMSIFKWFR